MFLAVNPKGGRVIGLNKIWGTVVELGTSKKIPAHQSIEITQHGTPYFYYVLSGTIKISCIETNGQERTILYGGPGTLLNVANMLSENPENTLVTSMEDSEIVLFSGSLLKDVDFAREHPELMINLVHSLAVHLEIHSQQLGDSTLISTKTHVCRIMWEMSQNNDGKLCFCPGLSQAEMAALLGINRTTLTRILCRLKEDKIIGKFTKREIIILNPKELCELAECHAL